MQVDSELEPPQPSTSTAATPISATKRKFGYRQGLPLGEHISAAERRQRPIETAFVRCCMMSALVRGLACTECSESTLKIRAIDRRLGLACLLQTYCTTCGAVLNSTLSSDRVDDEKAGNVPFVVVRQAVAATMDMGVGHAGLVKLCRFMDMEPLQHKSYSRHVKAVTTANMTVVSMEVEAAEILWNRSMERGFRYTTMVSDGDSKSFRHLTNLRVYGDVEVHKEECVNHVAKRLGTALRKLAASGKKSGVTLGGRGFGRLTKTTMDRLEEFYYLAVRGNSGKLNEMHDAVWASFYHASSTDEKPQHDRCPVGADSWCFYQKALATGQKPGPHRVEVHTALSPEVASHVKEVYTRLSDKSLLERCLLGKTQNPNESLHSKIWAKCPKAGFVGLQRVLSATCAAVAEFNGGVEVTMRRLCGTMGIASGERLIASAEKADRKRMRESAGWLKHQRRLHDGPAESLVRPRLMLQPVTMPLEDSSSK